jgi:proteasome lid subunit RPN8/RPN11
MLRIRQAAYDAIRQHGEESWPHECCGILLGYFLAEAGTPVNAVEEAVRAENARTDSPDNRYEITPQELVKAQKAGREKGLEIVGFYHSHPDHPARWSRTDLEEAHWLGCSYAITSVEQGEARQTNSFRLTGAREEDKRFEDEEIQVTGTQHSGEGSAASRGRA